MACQQIRCKHCRRLVPSNPRQKEQKYCGRKQCQQARKNEWRRQQRETDPAYRQGERDSREKWIENHPEYKRPESGNKSTAQKPIKSGVSIHTGKAGRETGEQKRDALESLLVDKTRDYIISYMNSETGKRDALKVKIIAVSTS